MDGLLVGTGKLYPTPDDNSEALDSNLKFTVSGDAASWFIESGADDDYYYDGDSLRSSETLGDNEETRLQAIVDSDSSETIKFHWKVSCQSGYDYLRFYIDDTLKDSITGEQDWQQKSYTVSSGIHTLKWVYDDGGGSSGDNCGWVDFVQWSGPSPEQDASNWQAINYKHDLYGRRSEKKIDGYSTRYLYDGPQVIAEYDGNNNLLRKYIYGPGIDQPVCMIEVADNNAVYYYHFDAHDSVVALSDSSGDTVQTYEYSVYGQVAAEDYDFPNPYMFAGRRYDIEIGLYYNRARYYNPYTGRFLQADPRGYDDGMNMYAYCRNNSLNYTDPSGFIRVQGPNETLTAIIYSHPDKTIFGLVGEWDTSDIMAWYYCEADEILTANVNGTTLYVEIDNGKPHLNPSPPRDNNGEIVLLNNETKPGILNDAQAVVESQTTISQGPIFTVTSLVGGVFMTVGAALIQKGVYFAGGVTFVGGLTLVLIDLSRPLENQVQIIDDLRDPLEEGLGEMEEGEFPTFDSTNSEEEPWAGPVYPK